MASKSEFDVNIIGPLHEVKLRPILWDAHAWKTTKKSIGKRRSGLKLPTK